MKVSKDEVLYTANLAKLKIKEEEIDTFIEQMTEYLAYANNLDTVDTENVEPLSHVLEVENVMREDEIKEGLNIEEALKNAPKKEGRCFKVPKML